MARKVAKCGTTGGYNKHRRLGEEACTPCKTAIADYRRTRYQTNEEFRNRVLETQYKRHQERMVEDLAYNKKQKKRYQEIYKKKYQNPKFRQELSDNQKKWNKENRLRRRELNRKHSRIRRSKALGNGASKYTEAEVLEKYGSDCHICQTPIDLKANRQPGKPGWKKGLHIDHLVPILRGGPDTLENVRPAHGLCNTSKGAKVPQ
jgi:hypothetical protein